MWSNLSPWFDDREYSTMRSLQLRGRVSMDYSEELGGYIVKPLAVPIDITKLRDSTSSPVWKDV